MAIPMDFDAFTSNLSKETLIRSIFISVLCVKQASNGTVGGRGAFVQRSGFGFGFGDGVEGSGYAFLFDIGDFLYDNFTPKLGSG